MRPHRHLLYFIISYFLFYFTLWTLILCMSFKQSKVRKIFWGPKHSTTGSLRERLQECGGKISGETVKKQEKRSKPDFHFVWSMVSSGYLGYSAPSLGAAAAAVAPIPPINRRCDKNSPSCETFLLCIFSTGEKISDLKWIRTSTTTSKFCSSVPVE
jgi:hypothetical protein